MLIHYDKLLGKGAFGMVYLAEENNNYYAVKIENKTNTKALLLHESTILKKCNTAKNNKYLYCHSYYEDEQYRYMAMTLLGRSLDKHIKRTVTLEIPEIITFAIKAIGQLKFYHNKGYIHRDIKPANFMYDLKNENLYLVDFGLCTHRDAPIKKHKFVGTLNYMSINSLNKGDPLFTDDLYSLGYILIYMNLGKLYWSDIKYETKEQRNKKLINLKSNLSNSDLTKRFKCTTCMTNKIRCPYEIALFSYLKYLDTCNDNEIDYEELCKFFYNAMNHIAF